MNLRVLLKLLFAANLARFTLILASVQAQVAFLLEQLVRQTKEWTKTESPSHVSMVAF
jgi:hypothetical protein